MTGMNETEGRSASEAAAVANTMSGLRQALARRRDAKADGDAPGAPKPLVIPDGWGDRKGRRAARANKVRTVAKAQRDGKRRLIDAQRDVVAVRKADRG